MFRIGRYRRLCSGTGPGADPYRSAGLLGGYQTLLRKIDAIRLQAWHGTSRTVSGARDTFKGKVNLQGRDARS